MVNISGTVVYEENMAIRLKSELSIFSSPHVHLTFDLAGAVHDERDMTEIGRGHRGQQRNSNLVLI